MKTTILALPVLIGTLVSTTTAATSSPYYAYANLVANKTTRTGAGYTITSTPFNATLATLFNGTNIGVTDIYLVGAQTNVPGQTVNVTQITCQTYKDQYGLQRGSVAFNYAHGASLATNPVSVGYVLCYLNPS